MGAKIFRNDEHADAIATIENDNPDVAATLDEKDDSIRQLLSRMSKKSKQVKSNNDGTYSCITYK
jgi:hypothetical protein